MGSISNLSSRTGFWKGLLNGTHLTFVLMQIFFHKQLQIQTQANLFHLFFFVEKHVSKLISTAYSSGSKSGTSRII